MEAGTGSGENSNVDMAAPGARGETAPIVTAYRDETDGDCAIVVAMADSREQAMIPTSNYATRARHRAALHGMGRGPRRDGDRLARPRAHRPRHGRHRRAPRAALARDLPRHHRPRPVAMEPRAGARVLLRALREARGGAARSPRAATACTGWARRWAARWACTRPRARCRAASTKLVLNDIGPEVAASAIERIRNYAGSPPAFDTVGELEAYFRTVYKPYGAITDPQWRRLTESSDAPPARRPRDAALRPGDGDAVRPPPARLRPVGRVGSPRDSRCWCCAAPTPTCSSRPSRRR